MGFEEVLGLLVIISLFVLPAMALTTRLALQPMVEALLRLREGFMRTGDGDDEQRIARLEAELGDLRSEVARLRAAESFYRQLESGGAEER